MKMYFVVLCLSLSALSFAADKFTEQMSKNIEAIYKAQTADEYQRAINTFERIGNAEKSRWEPYYYAAFGYVLMAAGEQDLSKKDPLLDLAKASVDKAT